MSQGEKPHIREKKMIDSKKFMLTIFWNTQVFLVVDVLPEGKKFNGEYFIQNILKKIYEKTAHLRKNEQRKITLHFDI